MYHTDGRTDSQDDVNNRFSKICERAQTPADGVCLQLSI